MLYQKEFSKYNKTFTVGAGVDFSFPQHLHDSFELITTVYGTMKITVSDREYELKPGDGILVFPNQLHSLEPMEHSMHSLWIFSPDFVESFFVARSKMLPDTNLFRLSPETLKALYELQETDTPWKIKGVLYTACSEFDSGAVYHSVESDNFELLRKIFQYVENHYQEDCSLAATALALSFHPVYISRYFKERVGISYTEYVNRHRLNEARNVLLGTDDPILTIALNSGFCSLRTFNRNFRKYFGTTPHAYRENGTKSGIGTKN